MAGRDDAFLAFQELTPEEARHSFAESKPFDEPSPESTPIKNHNFWTLEYYQKYFDVSTDDVLQRIRSSMIPTRASPSYFNDTVRVKPDLYGPYWICITLIFTIAISGNISNYLQHVNSNYHWKYDFHLVSYAATSIFVYLFIVPLALWATLKFTTVDNSAEIESDEDKSSPGIISLFCLYGYSLFIYIPVSILWTIQVGWLQWLLVITAALLSGLVLVYLLLPTLRNSKYCVILIVAILCCHFLLAAGFMLYFFHVPSVEIKVPTVTIKPT